MRLRSRTGGSPALFRGGYLPLPLLTTGIDLGNVP